jgi:hypothetical protein
VFVCLPQASLVYLLTQKHAPPEKMNEWMDEYFNVLFVDRLSVVVVVLLRIEPRRYIFLDRWRW